MDATLYKNLNQLSTKILQVNSLSEFKHKVAGEIRKLLDFDRFTICIQSSSSAGFELLPMFDYRSEQKDGKSFMKLAYYASLKGYPKECFSNKEAISSDNVDLSIQDTVYNDELNKHLMSFICCPLAIEEHCFGVLTIAHRETSKYSKQDEEILKIIATWLAASIERWQLMVDLKSVNQSMQANQSALYELTKRLKAEQKELENTKHQLEASNSALENFAHIASHDLQEPLNNIINLTEFLSLKIEEGDTDLVKTALGHIHKGTSQMKQFIRDLLNFSKVGAELGSLETVNTDQVVNVVLKNLDALIVKNKAQVTVGKNLPPLKGHSTLIAQLFLNLIGNGLKYRSTSEPIISVSAEKKADWVEFNVTDNGKGISKEFHSKIFEIFQRAETDVTVQGTGIGLSTCKRIVERYKGKIWVESELNKGSTFKFTLPAA